MRQFHALKVAEVKRETPEAVSIRFEVPADLAPLYAYRQGQHLTLKRDIDGQDVRRSYSICAGVEEQSLQVAVKKIPGGLFSSFANDTLKAGDVVEVMPPAGHFYTELDPSAARQYVAFAAGSGITPVMSILKTVLAAEPRSRFLLVYGNRMPGRVLFDEQLAELKNRYMERLEVLHVLSQGEADIPLLNGRIDAEKCQIILKHMIDPQAIHAAFLCGPGEMIDTVEACLLAAGVDKRAIRHERFTAAGQPTGTPTRAPADSTAARITIIIDQQPVSFEHDGSKPILDAALDAGLNVPFACKGGVCCTCRAKVMEGEVDMAVNYNLEEEEVAAGYVLTCQSFPKSGKVVLNFDA